MPLIETIGSASIRGYTTGIKKLGSAVVQSTSGLQMYFDADFEYSSSLWKDLSGNANDMTPRNNPVSATTNGYKNIQCQYVSGTNTAPALYNINTLNNLQYISVETVFSVRDWNSNSSNQILWNKENTWEISTGRLNGSSGTPYIQWAWQTSSGSGWYWVNTNIALSQNTKYHLVLTYSPVDYNLRTYLNGSLAHTHNQTNSSFGSYLNGPLVQTNTTYPKLNGRGTGQTEVGDAGSHDYYRAAVWDRALNQSEITALYNDAKTRHGLP